MASPRSRPPGPLERDGVQRTPPADQRAADQQAHTLHHSDDELFSARVSALIAERRRLLRQGLIHRLQHLKAAILSSELNEHHESAEQSLLRSEQDQTTSHTQRTSSSVFLRSPVGVVSRLHSKPYVVGRQDPPKQSTAFSPYASRPTHDESNPTRQSHPAEPTPLSQLGWETNASGIRQAENTEQDLPAGGSGDHERLQMTQRRHSDPQLMHHAATLQRGEGGEIATTLLQPSFPETRPLPKDVQSLTPFGTKSFTIQSLPPFNSYGAHSLTENLDASEDQLPVIPQADSVDNYNVGHRRRCHSMDTAEVSASQVRLNVGFSTDNEQINASQHSVTSLPVRDKTLNNRYSTNQYEALDLTGQAPHRTTQNSPGVASRNGTDGRFSPVSPILSFEVQLYSSFAADITAPKKLGGWRFRYGLAKGQAGAEAHTGYRDNGSVSRTAGQVLYGDRQSYSSSVRINDIFSSLSGRIPSLSSSESVATVNPPASRSGQKARDPVFVDMQSSNLFIPPAGGTLPLSLLSMVFFDQELKSLISDNFRLSNAPRDKSLLQAFRISDHISCILHHQHPNSTALHHLIGSVQQSPFLANLYIERQHVDLSNSSTSPQWISDLRTHFGKVRIPVSANFQRRTYLNMCEHDERRAPTALWHFDNSNSLQHEGKLTESSKAQNHVAYATATNIRRNTSYYSNQGVHSSPGDTTVALNFGFQTRTNYPFRKTYLYTHRRGEVAREALRPPLAEESSVDALESAESPAHVLGPASQQSFLLGAHYGSSAPREAVRADGETQVYSISEEGKLELRKH